MSSAETILYLSKSSYGNFIVRALLDVTPKKDLGKVRSSCESRIYNMTRCLPTRPLSSALKRREPARTNRTASKTDVTNLSWHTLTNASSAS